MDARTADAYAACLAIARSHYENFPVASVLLPRGIRGPVAAIYAFARRADDVADEGDLSPETRLARLDEMASALEQIGEASPTNDPVAIALTDSVRRFSLPLQPLHDLLDAFRQDVTKQRYADFGELMQYCRRSANPVGRLLLHLTGEASPRNLALSDAVCSALQLINFYQDLEQDYVENGRIYLPQDEMARFGVTEDHIRQRITDASLRRLMHFQFQRADQLLRSGAPLGLALKGRFGLEIRLIVMGGARVLHRLKVQHEDLFTRPRLGPGDWWAILSGALFPKTRD